MVEGWFKEVLEEDLISDKGLIPQVYFSVKKVLTQKKWCESILIACDVVRESKEVAKGWRGDEIFEETFEESKGEDAKEMIVICRFDTEGLSSEESSPLAGAKYLSELREVESAELSKSEVNVSFNLGRKLNCA